jgi:hypothetical protein
MFIHPGKVPVNLRPSGNCWIIKPLLLVASSDTVYISEAMAKEYELIVSVAFLPVICHAPWPPLVAGDDVSTRTGTQDCDEDAGRANPQAWRRVY